MQNNKSSYSQEFMKRIIIYTTFILIAFCLNAQGLFVGSYNIRNKNDWDKKQNNDWLIRVEKICELINFESPDIFGTQEVLNIQLNDMLKLLDRYAYIGVGRDDGKEQGEYAAIFYNKERIELLENGDFWLAEQTDSPQKGWDAACIRICTWGKFRDRQTRKEFYFFNLHMDHVGVVARRESAKLVVEKIRQIAKTTSSILTGDFNVDQNNEIYTTFTQSGILKDSYQVAKYKMIPNGTFNSFNPLLKTNSRIDHIFVTKDFSVDNYAVMTNMYWLNKNEKKKIKGHDAPDEISFKEGIIRTPSDHYPIFARLRWK